MMMARYTAAHLLSVIVSLTAAPTCLAAFSSALPPHCSSSSSPSCANKQSSSKTALHNNVLPFCAEADIQQINLIDSSSNTINELGYDISSARGWMEHIEQMEGPKFGVGAYTVLRCDAIFHIPSSTNKLDCEWKIWGEKFHMNRLSLSFQTLTNNLFGADSVGSFFNNGGISSGITSISGMGSSVHTDSMFTQSIEETTHVINKLLEQATRSINAEIVAAPHNRYNLLQQNDDESWTQTLMLTILWTSSRQTGGGGAIKPLVRGHAAFANAAQPTTTANYMDGSILPTPITACVAIPKQLTPESLSVLPRRHGMNLNRQRQVGASASAKVSSWCRIRRPLEDPNRYKPHDGVVGEVILVRQPDTERGTNIMSYSNENFIHTLELLEGLISNLFVVYRDGTVRTAPVGLVLPGYARHLIIQELNERGFKVDSSNPPTMQDMRDGLWSEVFVTSAIRLVVPVERIIMPGIGANNDNNPHVLWEAPNDEYEPYRATKMIQSAMYQRGWSEATVKNVVVIND
jgi:hypothetical protein